MLNLNIKFTKFEEDIFNILLDVVKNNTPETVLRIAGGYIRDKLLGIESHDIDIAVSNMNGEEFANIVYRHIKNKNPDSVEYVANVKANPEQSKHLATAMLRINGCPIDFVNLRKESYTQSRIPIVESGTPEEDASRRDLTVNALFYNLNERKIEDFTGGLKDLEKKILRTPIDPIQTWTDDPLRLLRCVRFAAKYNFKIDENLYTAALDDNVRSSLRSKISAERIWREMAGYIDEHKKWKAGFLSGPNPKTALEILNKMKLFEVLFNECNIHYISAINNINKIPIDSSENSFVLVLAGILFWSDIKKVEKTLENLKSPINVKNRILNIIQNGQNLFQSDFTDKSLRRFLVSAGNDWKFIYKFSVNDDKIFQKLKKLEAEMGGTKLVSPVSGKDLIELGWKPGVNIGKALKIIDEKLLENPKLSKEEAIKIISSIQI